MSNFSNPTSRRNVLKVGGLGLAGAAFLAACGDDDPPGISGEAVPTTVDAPAVPVKDPTEMQIADAEAQIHTLASVELLVAKVYADHAKTVENAEIQPLLASFESDHTAAAKALVALSTSKAEPKPNEELNKVLVVPREGMLGSEDGVLSLMHDLESTLTATYINAVNIALEPATRQTLMAHGGASARRVTVLADGGKGAAPTDALYEPTDLIPAKAILSEENKAEADPEGAEGEGDAGSGT